MSFTTYNMKYQNDNVSSKHCFYGYRSTYPGIRNGSRLQGVFFVKRAKESGGTRFRTPMPSREFSIGHNHDYGYRNVRTELFILHVCCDSVRLVLLAVSLILQLSSRVYMA
jgi:hypothetical protein